MYRRRRRPEREIAFGFDSFLDIVANVVGVIIRMILVVWVGARSYQTGMELLDRPVEPEAKYVLPKVEEDPLEKEVAAQKKQLAELEAALLEQLRALELARSKGQDLHGQLTGLGGQRHALEQQQAALDRALAARGQTALGTSSTLADLQARRNFLMEEIRKLEMQPVDKKVLRYRTPVSTPVRAEEYHFELLEGRIAFVDFPALINEIKRVHSSKAQALRYSWEVSDITPPIGAFRLRYILERERGILGSILETAPEATNFSYHLREAIVDPVRPVRGETVEQALTPGSQFRQIVDGLDRTAVVTFWVYPDSFALYRELREHLYQRDVIVAGRPLPAGHPIVCSRNGSLSRGQ
ncbi:MAG: hypothetical protein AB7K24_32730 [Gemmataceae bacterium]